MYKRQNIWMICLLSAVIPAAWGQDNSTPSPAPPADTAAQEPVPAYGQERAPLPISENPPLSGMDQPGLEQHGSPLSYLQLGATVSESADSNITNSPGGNTPQSLTHALGNVTLQRLWRNYDLAVDYVGGIGYYNLKGEGLKSLQEMDLEQKVTWKRGQLLVRDSFSYQPEGGFGGGYGALGTEGIGALNNTAFAGLMGSAGLGGLGQAPRILNVSLAEISQTLTPKSAITAAGGYAFTHFYGNDLTTGTAFIGGSQISAEAGYDRLLSAHTQVAVVYAYQGFDYNVFGTAFHSHVLEGVIGHRISGRMDFQLAAGPQVTFIDMQGATLQGNQIVPVVEKDTRLGAAGRAQLRYKFPRTSLDLSYQRLLTSGSGLFAGAQSDILRLGVERPLSRVWGVNLDIGAARNARIQPLTQGQLQECLGQTSGQQNACPANDATTYYYGFAGASIHRTFGHDFQGFTSFQFNELVFNRSFCLETATCDRISNRFLVTIGLNWTPRPMRID